MVEEDTVSTVIPVQDTLDILLVLTDPLPEVSMSELKNIKSEISWDRPGPCLTQV